MKAWQRRILGILTLGGGILGLVTSVTMLLSSANPIVWGFCLFFIALYAWGVWCGIRIFEKDATARGCTLKYWIIQIPTFSSPFLGYAFVSGFHLTPSIQLAPFAFNINFWFGSTFTYSLMQSNKPWLLGVNVFAVAVVIWLARQKNNS